MEMQPPSVTDDLRIFHAEHFPHAPAPAQFVSGAETTEEICDEYLGEEDDGLGYYEDGVKRTLTDEQIALFRHSEIQSIIRERRRRRENGNSPEPKAKRESPDSSNKTQKTDQGNASGDKVLGGRVEKQTNWTKLSAKSKQRNKNSRNRWRANQREKKKMELKEEEESDEWDPWHQANGPDVQKDTTIDLDY
ncbi:hypothetical protein K504DRAFT_43698 [Pleomassaria siparia CBS 279.74]|uniref:Uncharacterized protein n=1 Tax=Pleomassaria siparia CBS 279.74 TaxID=1314801 RepID=A0A6G1K5R4_9PLEO|nr:hypothetical protein K504DRAFT_43698 [Pleomassaria siparia CBS 279.74]